ncbi:MAG TPA: PEP-CTERM sorting domain-containing protein [Chthonomonadaceae bacterium]|nr:PEP-CTERM sorting domain-containing protein [Chthonomonadaceae bacterium]
MLTLRHVPARALRTAILCGVVLLAYSAGTARADIIPQLELLGVVADTSNPGEYTWTYRVDLTNNEFLNGGNTAGKYTKNTDWVTLYDFVGYDSAVGINFSDTSAYDTAVGTTSVSDWYNTVQNKGVTPTLVVPSDNAAIPNLTFEYIGAGTGAGPQTLGYFTIDSNVSVVDENGNFTSSAHNTGGGMDQNVGPLDVPAPEPPALAMLAGTGVLGWSWRRRRAKLV